MISRNPDAAVYRQLAAILRAQIHDGRLAPGQRLPSETTLMQTYGLARETVRRAVRELDIEGLVTVEPGRGTWIRPPVEPRTIRVPRGARLTCRMPTLDEVTALDVPRGLPVLIVEYGGQVGVYATAATTFTTA